MVRSYFSVMPSPIGPLTMRWLVGTGRDALVGVYFANSPLRHGREWTRDDACLSPVRRQLEEYFAGERTKFDIPLAFEGTEFQQRVWTALCQIPFGKTTTYGALAKTIGHENWSGARAVGAANGQNRIVIIVPCHRVIGANGSLTGFGGGLPRKRALLSLEQRQTELPTRDHEALVVKESREKARGAKTSRPIDVVRI